MVGLSSNGLGASLIVCSKESSISLTSFIPVEGTIIVSLLPLDSSVIRRNRPRWFCFKKK